MDGHGGVVVRYLPGLGQLTGHVVHGDILGGPVVLVAALLPVGGPQALIPQRVVPVVGKRGIVVVVEFLPVDSDLAAHDGIALRRDWIHDLIGGDGLLGRVLRRSLRGRLTLLRRGSLGGLSAAAGRQREEHGKSQYKSCQFLHRCISF